MNLPVHRIDDIVVPREGPVIDPRLESIDLRDKLAWTRALLVTPLSGPLADAEVRIEDADGHGGPVRTDAEGWISALVPTSARKLRLVAPGYRRVEFTKDDTIKLVPE
jgi:hypothetical protein